MKDYKKEYENIKAPASLKNSVNNKMKIELQKSNFRKRMFTSVAAVFALFVSIVNIFPQVAYAADEIPIIGQVVRIITLNRFNYEDNGLEANVTTPKIEGLLDPEVEKQLNEEFKEYSDLVIAEFEVDAKEIRKEFGDEEVHSGIDSNYIVKTNNADFLAINLYTVNTVGSSSTVHSYFTIDKKQNRRLSLKDLFEKNADYPTILSVYLKEEMIRQMEEEGTVYWIEGIDEIFGEEGFSKISEEQKFYINEYNQLVICFDKYEIAPGAEGSPEFVIPIEVIAEILDYENIK